MALMVLLLRASVPPLLRMPPPPPLPAAEAELPLTVLRVNESEPLLYMPPPPAWVPPVAELPLTVLLLNVSVPVLKMPPPVAWPPEMAAFPMMVLAVTLRAPALLMPPPLAELPLVTISPLKLELVTPEPTVKTVDAALPLTVTMFVSAAPAPCVGPLIEVFDGMFSVPLVSVMNCAPVNVEVLKLILLEPSAADCSSASRRLHEPSVPCPGVACGVQLPAVPSSSVAVVTTRFGTVTVVPLDVADKLFAASVAVMVCVPKVLNVAVKVPVPLLIALLPGRLAAGSELVKATVPP